MKYFSAFTGVAGFDLGVPNNWECVGFSEVDKNANKVLKYRFPEVINYGDIEKINYGELPDFEALIGGSPCQDVSIAGKRAGINGIRSRLFFSYIAILKIKKPRYFIFENVKGLLSSNAGWDFAEVLNQFSEAGYDIWWQVLDATQFGIPQHRERVFVLGTLRENGFRKVFFEPKNNRKNTELQGQQANTITRRYRQSEATGTYITESKLDAQIENMHFSRSQQNRVYGTNGIAPTLHRNTGGQQVTKIVASHGRFIDGKWVQQLESRDDGNVNTLTRVQKDNMVAMPALIGHDSEYIGARTHKTEGEPAYTILSSHPRGVYDGVKIRYLTPLECERLMGWPDDWTRYGINDKGNTIELSDNARYNLIGNGVVPQVVSGIVELMLDGI